MRNSFDEVYERIRRATSARTQVELASILDIQQSSISDAKRRGSVPVEWYIKLYDKFGLSLDWMRWGSGSMYSKDKIDRVHGENGGEPDSAPRLGEDSGPAMSPARGVLTRVLDTVCDYREDGGKPEFAAHDHMVLPHTVLEPDMQVFFVRSGGMEPTLRKGAVAGVSTRQRQIISGDVYAVLMPYEGVIFRRIVQDSESGLFLLCFDQAGLPHMRISVKTLQNRILGKVVWTLQPL